MFKRLGRSSGRRDDRRGTGVASENMVITGHSGLVDGTYVATAKGWVMVHELKPGDFVSTFDHGEQQINEMQRETLYQAQHMLQPQEYPVFVPAGAMEDNQDMWLMPDQGIMVECDAASDSLGDPFAIIPAKVLVGHFGVTQRMPRRHLRRTTLIFDQDEVVYAGGNVLAHCPAPRRILLEGARISDGLYQVLDEEESRRLVERLVEDVASRTDAAPHESMPDHRHMN